MKYKVSDVVKRALSLADMSNSQVVDYEETNKYLNQAWTNVCQKCINHGIKYFYDEVEVTVGYNELPWDFYQIDAIQSKYGYNLPKHTRSDPENKPSYDIIGNKLFIYGSIVPSMKMKYWKKPITLTWPNKAIKIDNIPLSDISSFYDTKMVYSINNEIHIYDLKTEEDKTIEEADSIVTLVAGRGMFYVKALINSSSKSIICSYNGNIISAYTDSENNTYAPMMLQDGSLGVYRYSDGHILIEDWKQQTDDIEVTTELDDEETLYEYFNHYYVSINSEIVDVVTDEKVTDGNWLVATTFEDRPALLSDKTITFYNEEEDKFEESIDITNKILAILKGDINTGYGYLTTDGTDYYIESWIPDTLLDFPSSLMFDFLSYQMAYYYSLRLGLDLSNITMALNVAEEAFYDSIDQNGDFPSISDVVGGYGWL